MIETVRDRLADSNLGGQHSKLGANERHHLLAIYWLSIAMQVNIDFG